MDHNIAKLHAIGQPIATIKALRLSIQDQMQPKSSPEDAGGLQPVLYLAHDAHKQPHFGLMLD